MLLFNELITRNILFSNNCLTNTVVLANIGALLNHYQVDVRRRKRLRISNAVDYPLLTGGELNNVLSEI